MAPRDRDKPPANISISEWRRYVQRETQRLLRQQEEQDKRAPDPVATPPEPPATTGKQKPVVPPAAAPKPVTRGFTNPVISQPAPRGQAPGFEAGLDDLANFESEVQPLTPELIEDIKRERAVLLPDLPAAQRIPLADEAALLQQASTPLEAEEAALAQAQTGRDDVNLSARTSHLLKAENRDSLETVTGEHLPVSEAELAIQDTAVDLLREAQPPEQATLFDPAVMARSSMPPVSPKKKREDLIEDLLDPVISLEQAATILNVCKTTVRRYTNQGLLECIRTPGNQRRFKLSTILGFVEVKDVKGIGKRGRKPTKSKVTPPE